MKSLREIRIAFTRSLTEQRIPILTMCSNHQKGKKKKLPRKLNLSLPKVRRIKIPTSLRWPHLPSNPRSETTMINRSKRTSTILMINDCLSDKSRKKCKTVIYMKLLKKDDFVIV